MEQHIIVMGDMNCKIDHLIDGNLRKLYQREERL